MKDKLIEMLTNYRPNDENIRLNVYGGYSLIHIDIYYDETPALYTTVDLLQEDEPLILKICSFDKVCSETNKDIVLIRELEQICKTLNIKKIYGRAKILKDIKLSKKFYNDIGYKFDFRPKDKSYLSAIVSKEF